MAVNWLLIPFQDEVAVSEMLPVHQLRNIKPVTWMTDLEQVHELYCILDTTIFLDYVRQASEMAALCVTLQ
jgi:hypothetical protein